MTQDPALKEWKRLFAAARELRRLSPWQWMADDDLFGVQDPESGEIGYVSVVGKLGEVLGLLAYLGREGLYSYLDLRHSDPEEPDWDLIIGQRCLRVFFEDREELPSRDYALIRKLGLSFRGRRAWPCFRSHRPGYKEWYLDRDEVRYFTFVLEQALEVGERLRDDPEFLDRGNGARVLVRVPLDRAGKRWEDRWLEFPPPPPLPPVRDLSADALARLKRAPRARRGVWEVDMFGVPALIQGERGSPPYYPASLLCVHRESGLVVGVDLEPFTTRFEGLPSRFASLLEKAELDWPEEVWVRRAELVASLAGLLGELGIKLVFTGELSALEEARASLLDLVQEGGPFAEGERP